MSRSEDSCVIGPDLSVGGSASHHKIPQEDTPHLVGGITVLCDPICTND